MDEYLSELGLCIVNAIFFISIIGIFTYITYSIV